jgi:hypothetical protein
MFGHEGSHKSFSASPTRNALLTYITFALVSGVAAVFGRSGRDRLQRGHASGGGGEAGGERGACAAGGGGRGGGGGGAGGGRASA